MKVKIFVVLVSFNVIFTKAHCTLVTWVQVGTCCVTVRPL